jgi:manganese transport protein
MLGPAFVAGIAYVDPGNVATNTAAGARYGYLLIWVLVAANLMAIVVQYLSAKLGIATGESLAHACRRHYRPATVRLLWVQAETIAVATDLAEVVGGAIALHILFRVPLVVGGVLTALASLAILATQAGEHQRRFERVIVVFLGVIVIGFGWSLVASDVSFQGMALGLAPRFRDGDSVLLSAAMLGATVMPHAVYLHSALVVDRFGRDRLQEVAARRMVLRATKRDVVLALMVAGAVNIAMLVVAAATLAGSGSNDIESAHAGVAQALGAMAAALFALGLLASGLASSSVGTYAGSVILDGFLNRQIDPMLRRVITIFPALLVLAVGVSPSSALVISQVVLSMGIPFALVPLIRFTNAPGVMSELANRRLTSLVAALLATAIILLNVALVALTAGDLVR